MKKYFEYKFNTEVEKKLDNYYENSNLSQHNANHFLKANLKLKRISDLLLFTKEDIVLDVGCSSGQLLKTIAPMIDKGKGVDISKNIINSNIKNNQIGNISYEIFDGKELKLSKKYNKVLLMDVLEHSFYPNKLISTIKNIMTPDGVLIVGVPFTGFLSELVFGKYHQGHLRYYDPKYLSNYFKNLNFEVIKITIRNSVPWSSKFIKISFFFKIFDFLVNLISPTIYPYFGEIIIVLKNKKIK
jgi:SAM-dependent methyltransferase